MDETLETPSIHEPLAARPKLRTDLEIQPQEFAGQACYVIEDPLRGRFFRVGLPEYELLRRLDGSSTLATAIGQAAMALGKDALGQREGVAVCRWLAQNQLLADANGHAPVPKPLWQRFNPLAIKLTLANPDRWLAALLPWFRWLFSRGFLLLWLCVGLYAVWIAWLHAGKLTLEARAVLAPDNWWRMLAAWLALKLVHETAHGLACKHFGGEVTRAGVMFVLLAPLAFVDVTSSWRFRSKWPRIITAAAGMYVELFVAAGAMIAWRELDEGLTRRLLFDLALMASAGTLLVNANPLMRFDGYFILSDLIGIPNLNACGQQWFLYKLQCWLGLSPAAPDWPQRSWRIIPVYYVASLAWRAFVFLAIALALVAGFSYAGGVLAVVLLLWRSTGTVNSARRLWQTAAGHPQVVRRAVFLGAAACILIGVTATLLLRPAWISAPAVVEYAPLTVIRAAVSGFVEEVHVVSGDKVVAGQAILTLRNDELAIELAELTLAFEQSRLRARMHQQAEEQAKYQAELAQGESLAKKRSELERRVGCLTVRAPLAGRLMSRTLAQLAGQHIAPGDEIAILGDESSKELLVAVPQADLQLFRERLGQPLQVDLADSRNLRLLAPLNELEPRATQEPPHLALLATSGGPLAVVSIEDSVMRNEQQPASQLLTPCFTARVSMSSEQSEQLCCGQLAAVGFHSAQETVVAHIARSLSQWLGDQLNLAGR